MRPVPFRCGARLAAVLAASLLCSVVSSTTTAGATAARTSAHGAVHAEPGSYSGINEASDTDLTLYVALNGASVQDLSIPTTYLSCTPTGTTIADHVDVYSIALHASGAFASTTTEHGVFDGYAATYTTSIAGHFEPPRHGLSTRAAGTFRETIKYTHNELVTCTTKTQTFAVSRGAQGPQTAAPPPVGSYRGHAVATVTFFVAANRSSLEDVSIPDTYLSCTPDDVIVADHVGVLKLPLHRDGSFSSTTTQHGVFYGFPATFTYKFQGHFHGLNAANVERAAGTFEETVTYTNNELRTCTSNAQIWSASRSTQGPQTTARPPVGSYSGADPQSGTRLTFYVGSNRSSLQDLSVASDLLVCSPGDLDVADHVGVYSIALHADGSFSSTTTQHGEFDGFPATFTYVVAGSFHGENSADVERAAGTWSETITYTNSILRTCTTNDQSFSVARGSQGAQTPGRPPAGSYAGKVQVTESPLTFTVTAGGATVTTVAMASVYLTCAPGDVTVSEPFALSGVTVAADGSFSKSASQPSTFEGHAATITYMFEGHFHGLSAGGQVRAAGMFTETMTYTDTSTKTCSSDAQNWAASKQP